MSQPPGQEHRRSPRLQIREPMQAKLSGLAEPAPVRDFSLGGFSIETSTSLEPGTEHSVQFVPDRTLQGVLRARTVYCRLASPDGEPARFVAGFAFLDQDERTKASARALIDQILKDSTKR